MKNGSIRFGLSNIKNVGENFAEELIKNRKEKGLFNNVFEIAERLSAKVWNKKNIENLAMAGAFDTFHNINRAVFFEKATDGLTLIDKLSKILENQQKKQSIGHSLFDIANSGDNQALIKQYPDILPVKDWDFKTKLLKEREVLGLFISSKPTDEYPPILLKSIPHISIRELEENIGSYKDQTISIIGWSISIEKGISKKGKPYYNLTLEDATGSIKLSYIDNSMAEQIQLEEKAQELNCFWVTLEVRNRNLTDDPVNDRWDYRVTNCIDFNTLLMQKAEMKVLVNVKDIQLNMIQSMEKIFQKNGGIPIRVSLIITDDERKNYLSTANILKMNFDEENIKVFDKYNLEYKLVIK